MRALEERVAALEAATASDESYFTPWTEAVYLVPPSDEEDEWDASPQ